MSSLFLNWVGLMQELLENHFEKKPNFLWSAMPNCFYWFALGEKLEGINFTSTEQPLLFLILDSINTRNSLILFLKMEIKIN